MKMTFATAALVLSTFAGFSAQADQSPAFNLLQIGTLTPIQSSMTCTCNSLDANQFSQAACNALPTAQCGRVGNIICIPKCSFN